MVFSCGDKDESKGPYFSILSILEEGNCLSFNPPWKCQWGYLGLTVIHEPTTDSPLDRTSLLTMSDLLTPDGF